MPIHRTRHVQHFLVGTVSRVAFLLVARETWSCIWRRRYTRQRRFVFDQFLFLPPEFGMHQLHGANPRNLPINVPSLVVGLKSGRRDLDHLDHSVYVLLQALARHSSGQRLNGGDGRTCGRRSRGKIEVLGTLLWSAGRLSRPLRQSLSPQAAEHLGIQAGQQLRLDVRFEVHLALATAALESARINRMRLWRNRQI